VSRVTSVALEVFPSGSTPSTVTAGALWVSGSWVQVIASAAANLHVAGLALGALTTSQFEVDIGIGALGVETVLHTVRHTLGNSGSESNVEFAMLPIPVGGITSGDRVVVRVRSSVASATYAVGLLAYSSLGDTDHLTSLQLKTAPAGASAITITPSGTSWAYSAWTEVWTGTSVETCLLGIITNGPIGPVELEYEIGLGPSGSEVAKTLIRTSQNSSASFGALRAFYLPAPFPVPPNTHVTVRLRKNGTNITTHTVALLYLDNTNLTGVDKTASEAITVTDAVTAVLTADIYLTAIETIAVAESVTQRPGTLLIQAFESLSTRDDATLPAQIAATDRVFVRDAVTLRPSQLTIRATEAISILEAPLFTGSQGYPGGTPGGIGPEPPPPSGSTGLVDYWSVGL
jgi:hypothetical protein